ncbi:MAG TPA: hypothetical protein VIN71_04720 [Pseudomonadales bacterium]
MAGKNRYGASVIEMQRAFVSLFAGAGQWLDTVNSHNCMAAQTLDALARQLNNEVEGFIAMAEQLQQRRFLRGQISALWEVGDGERFRVLLTLYLENRRGRALLHQLEKALPLRLLDNTSTARLKTHREIRYDIRPGSHCRNGERLH